jgi:hypothetical protein
VLFFVGGVKCWAFAAPVDIERASKDISNASPNILSRIFMAFL